MAAMKMRNNSYTTKFHLCGHRFPCRRWFDDIPPRAQKYFSKRRPWIRCPNCQFLRRLPAIYFTETGASTQDSLDEYFKGFSPNVDLLEDTKNNPLLSQYESSTSSYLETLQSASFSQFTAQSISMDTIESISMDTAESISQPVHTAQSEDDDVAIPELSFISYAADDLESAAYEGAVFFHFDFPPADFELQDFEFPDGSCDGVGLVIARWPITDGMPDLVLGDLDIGDPITAGIPARKRSKDLDNVQVDRMRERIGEGELKSGNACRVL